MNQNEVISIEAASVVSDKSQQLTFQVVINYQETPAISLDALRRLRDMADHFIVLGENLKQSEIKQAD